MRLLGSSLVAAFVCASVGCSDVNAPTSIAVRATLENAQVRTGNPVRVSVEVENTGSKAVSINSAPAIAFLQVRNAAGTVIFFGRSGAFDVKPRTILDIGERVSDDPVWSGELMGPADVSPRPGTYQIRAAVPIGSKGSYVLSDPLEITLVQ